MYDGIDRQDLFINLDQAPDDWAAWIENAGVKPERIEAQPIADRVKLHKCAEVPATLPAWVKRGDMYLG
jgi:hypothetical protein